jgi:hypothetical protein
MPTTPYPEGYDPESMLVGEDALPHRVLRTVQSALGGSGRLPVRVVIYTLVAAVCVALAPIPWNVFGVVALGLLAFDIGLNHRRS